MVPGVSRRASRLTSVRWAQRSCWITTTLHRNGAVCVLLGVCFCSRVWINLTSRIVGCGKISGLFVQDLCLSRVDVTDVVHSIAAVGSRDKIKAEGFIQDQCPKGASAQQQGLVSKKPEACGSYEEVYTHSVG